MKKVWPEFCPFRTYLMVQHNISDIFSRFSISSCIKKMKTQETLKKNTGYINVQCVTNDFLIFTLSKTVKYVLQWWMKKVWLEFCPFRNYLRVQHAAKNKWWFIFAATSAKLQVAKKWGEYVIPLKTKTKHLWPDTRVVHVFMKIIIELFVLPFLNANTVCTYLTD